METTNLTFEQQLIHTLLKSFIQENGYKNLIDADIYRIRSFAQKLSEGTEPKNGYGVSPETRLTEFDFKVRTLNGLKYNGINTVGDLISKTERQLTMLRLIGHKSYREINEFLIRYNLKLKEE